MKKLKNIAKKSWRREEEENTRNIKERYVKRETNNFYVSALQPFYFFLYDVGHTCNIFVVGNIRNPALPVMPVMPRQYKKLQVLLVMPSRYQKNILILSHI